MTLTKAELADLLFEKVGFNKREAKDMVESFYEEVRIALQNGDGVKLSGFGNFQLRDKPQRPGRNPKTGEETIGPDDGSEVLRGEELETGNETPRPSGVGRGVFWPALVPQVASCRRAAIALRYEPTIWTALRWR